MLTALWRVSLVSLTTSIAPSLPVTVTRLGSGTGVFKKVEDAKSGQEAINGLGLAGKKILVQLGQDQVHDLIVVEREQALALGPLVGAAER